MIATVSPVSPQQRLLIRRLPLKTGEEKIFTFYKCVCSRGGSCCSLVPPPPSNLLIWAALNAFPFGLITLWEDWHHARGEQLISALGHLATLHFLSGCIAECVQCVCVCVCVGVGRFFDCIMHTNTHFPSDIRLSSVFSFIWCLSRKSNQLHIQLHLDLWFNLVSLLVHLLHV